MTQFDLFDAEYYAKYNPDLPKAGIVSEIELRKHFENYGIDEGRSFNPHLYWRFYRQANPDLAKLTNRQLYNHIQEFGVFENRRVSLFEPARLSDRSTNTDDLLFGTRNNNLISGGQGNDKIFGGQGNDILFGDQGFNILEGGSGDDKLYSDDGVGILYGGSGDDFLHGGTLSDTLYGGRDNDNLLGNKGNDRLVGGEGSDVLDGGDGNDILIGGLNRVLGDNNSDGHDFLIGGAGSDRFNFPNFYDKGIPAIIVDFSSIQGDRIEVSKVGFGASSVSQFSYSSSTGDLSFNSTVFAELNTGLAFQVSQHLVLI